MPILVPPTSLFARAERARAKRARPPPLHLARAMNSPLIFCGLRDILTLHLSGAPKRHFRLGKVHLDGNIRVMDGFGAREARAPLVLLRRFTTILINPG